MSVPSITHMHGDKDPSQESWLASAFASLSESVRSLSKDVGILKDQQTVLFRSVADISRQQTEHPQPSPNDFFPRPRSTPVATLGELPAGSTINNGDSEQDNLPFHTTQSNQDNDNITDKVLRTVKIASGFQHDVSDEENLMAGAWNSSSLSEVDTLGFDSSEQCGVNRKICLLGSHIVCMLRGGVLSIFDIVDAESSAENAESDLSENHSEESPCPKFHIQPNPIASTGTAGSLESLRLSFFSSCQAGNASLAAVSADRQSIYLIHVSVPDHQLRDKKQTSQNMPAVADIALCIHSSAREASSQVMQASSDRDAWNILGVCLDCSLQILMASVMMRSGLFLILFDFETGSETGRIKLPVSIHSSVSKIVAVSAQLFSNDATLMETSSNSGMPHSAYAVLLMPDSSSYSSISYPSYVLQLSTRQIAEFSYPNMEGSQSFLREIAMDSASQDHDGVLLIFGDRHQSLMVHVDQLCDVVHSQRSCITKEVAGLQSLSMANVGDSFEPIYICGFDSGMLAFMDRNLQSIVQYDKCVQSGTPSSNSFMIHRAGTICHCNELCGSVRLSVSIPTYLFGNLSTSKHSFSAMALSDPTLSFGMVNKQDDGSQSPTPSEPLEHTLNRIKEADAAAVGLTFSEVYRVFAPKNSPIGIDVDGTNVFIGFESGELHAYDCSEQVPNFNHPSHIFVGKPGMMAFAVNSSGQEESSDLFSGLVASAYDNHILVSILAVDKGGATAVRNCAISPLSIASRIAKLQWNADASLCAAITCSDSVHVMKVPNGVSEGVASFGIDQADELTLSGAISSRNTQVLKNKFVGRVKGSPLMTWFPKQTVSTKNLLLTVLDSSGELHAFDCEKWPTPERVMFAFNQILDIQRDCPSATCISPPMHHAMFAISSSLMLVAEGTEGILSLYSQLLRNKQQGWQKVASSKLDQGSISSIATCGDIIACHSALTGVVTILRANLGVSS